MSKLDFKSILIGVFATTTLMVSINATTENNNNTVTQEKFLVADVNGGVWYWDGYGTPYKQ